MGFFDGIKKIGAAISSPAILISRGIIAYTKGVRKDEKKNDSKNNKDQGLSN